MSQGNQVVDNRPTVTVSEILAKLEAGISRKQIAEDMKISYASAQRTIFNHPKLRNRKVLPQSTYVLIDDAPDAPESAPRTTDASATDEAIAETVEATETATEASTDAPSWRE